MEGKDFEAKAKKKQKNTLETSINPMVLCNTNESVLKPRSQRSF